MDRIIKEPWPGQPSVSRATRKIISAAAWAAHLRPSHARLAVLAGFAGSVLLEYQAGALLNPALPYVLTIVLAGWCLGEAAALAVTLAAAAAITLLHGNNVGPLDQSHPPTLFAILWNGFARMCMLGLFGLAASALRSLVELVRWRSDTDGLTGALNKAAFRNRLGPFVAAAAQARAAIVVAYMDLDGFKHVNDLHGHLAGDQVLCHFAEGAQRVIRGGDLFARIGGDEFIAVLAVESCDEGDQAAEALHARLAKVLLETDRSVTCSTGALVLEASLSIQPDRLIETGDKLMYEVKRSGKAALRIARAQHLPIRRAGRKPAARRFDWHGERRAS